MRKWNAAFLSLGGFCMLMALFFSNITIASNDYRIILLLALACMVLADVCFAVVIYRGGDFLRFVAVLMASPSLFIIWDFLRRALSSFVK